jgi:2'-5' RNA ligase
VSTNRARQPQQQSSDTWRVFAAVPVNDAVRELMRATQDELRAHAWPVRWVDPALAHLTVRFFGELPLATVRELERELERIAALARHYPPIELRIGGAPHVIGARNRPPVLVVGHTERLDQGGASQLARLADDTRARAMRLGLPGDNRRFRIHLTLGRFRNDTVAPPDAADILRAAARPAVSLPVEHLQLIRSVLGRAGPTYTTIAEWPLRQIVMSDE